MKHLAWMLLLLCILVTGCDESVEHNEISGVVSDVKHFGDDYHNVSLTFEDGQVVSFRILRGSTAKGTFIFERGKHHTVYYDNWGDVQKVQIGEKVQE